MAGGFPLGLELCNGQAIVVTGTSTGTVVTASGSINTKGAFTQLIAATAFDTCWMGVFINDTSGTGTVMVDIAIGAAAAEKVIVQNLTGCGAFIVQVPSFFHFPIMIPAGTRISARSQSAHASEAGTVSVYLWDGAFTQMEGGAGVDSIGALTASSHGTTITANASANTKGSYVSLGVTARDYIGLSVGMDQGVSTANSTHFLFDIAIGAGGAQSDIIPNIAGTWDGITSDALFPTSWGPFFIPIPSGTNLWARWQTGAGSNQICIAAYGIYQ
jgi:hypothetical protein